MCIMHYSYASGDLTYVFPRKEYTVPSKETKAVKDETLFSRPSFCTDCMMQPRIDDYMYKNNSN